MRPVTFVICAAGKGERFRRHGLHTPKPRLLLKGRTILERSLESLDLRSHDQVIVISQKNDNLPGHFPNLTNIDWLEIDQETRGQLETFLLGINLIKHNDIVIYNCDTYFLSPTLRTLIESGKYDGIIPCSKEQGTAWSFCEVDEDFNILNVAEKKRISEWASVGYYYFKDKNLLSRLAQVEVKNVLKGEPYVAPLYNMYLNLNLPLKMAPVDKFLPFGTLDQVHDYWGVTLEDLLEENK